MSEEEKSWRWLESTKELQEQAFGFELPIPEGEELVNYVIWNHSALVVEAGELLDEFRWKPWAKGRGSVNRELAIKEAVDVGHFLANILAAIGVTDEEWIAAYQAKQQVNRDRMSSGVYDGISSKCSLCKRAYDDPGVDCQGAVTKPSTPHGKVQPAYCGHNDVYIVDTNVTCPYCAFDYADTAGCWRKEDGTFQCSRRHTSSLRE